jgi:hypothetical protein
VNDSVVTSRRLYELITEAQARIGIFQIACDLEFGLQRRWNGECETYTPAGLEEMAIRLEARGFTAAAAIVRSELARLVEAPPAAVHKHRSHLPYKDADDEALFSAAAAAKQDAGKKTPFIDEGEPGPGA